MTNNPSTINMETKVNGMTTMHHIHLKILLNSVQGELIVVYGILIMRMSSN